MNPSPTVIIGENLVDLLVSPDSTLEAVVGGGPFNVARTIGRLGGNVRFVSGVSSDAFGSQVRAALTDSGVRLAVERPLDLPSALAVVELGSDGPTYHFHVNETAAFALTRDEVAGALTSSRGASAVYFGTLGLVVEPMASSGEDAVLAVPDDVLVVIDPNCRPHAVRHPGRYRRRLERLHARADVVKVSTEDLAYLFPGRSARDGARALVDEGARCVIITDGAGPVSALGDGIDVTVEVAPVAIADTVGAGDALVGGFLAWWTGHGLSRHDARDAASIESAISAAVEISRLTCQRAGAQPPSRSDVGHLAQWAWL